MSSPPRVGVGVFVFSGRDNKFIIGQRKGSEGAGTFALPGGHLEHGESFEACAAREVLEETGLTLAPDMSFLTATNTVFPVSGKHYVTIFMTATVVGSTIEPQLIEPDKCEGWSWSSFAEMRDVYGKGGNTLFLPLVELLRSRPEVCEELERRR